MKLSVVTTVYKSEEFILEFYTRIVASIEKLGIENDYEIIFVNDGSPDESLFHLIEIQKNNNHVKVLDFSRNFGHHNAIMAGLEYSSGEKIFLIDIDLEEPPEVLTDFYCEIINNDNDVIYGIKKTRGGSHTRNLGGKIFYKLFNKLSNVKIEPNALTVRIMSQRFVRALVQHKEKDLFLSGVFSLTGFVQKGVLIEAESRRLTSYSLSSRINLFIQALVSFSSFPLVVFFYMGIFITSLTFVYAFFLVIQVNVNDKVLEGWTTIVVSIWLLSGVIMTALGVIGVYLSKIFNEVKNRPRYIVKKKYGK
ncbi:glycosyltransferase family 2 protein [Vibrio amylolyticus]|uniref:glycosyltransferase family 2 protein n=1 Tax=Vibrio amylolyticus TaxID=2847292 RepID=UPI00354C9E89